MLDFQRRRMRLLLYVGGIIVLSIIAEKSREMVGEENSSQSGKFTILNCFDMSSGTIACMVKEGVKLYANSIRTVHVEKVRHKAIESSLQEALSSGTIVKEAVKQAQKEGDKAAKIASRQAKRITGPIISSGWDFFEAIYYGGTLTEGFIRGAGTLIGTYTGGFQGEMKLGRLGYLAGSQLGSWVGGRIGLMVYDTLNGVHFMLRSVLPQENTGYVNTYETTESSQSYEF